MREYKFEGEGKVREGESYYWKPPTAPTNPKPFALCARTKIAKNKEVEGLREELLKELTKYLKAAPGIVGQHTVDDIRNGF